MSWALSENRSHKGPGSSVPTPVWQLCSGAHVSLIVLVTVESYKEFLPGKLFWSTDYPRVEGKHSGEGVSVLGVHYVLLTHLVQCCNAIIFLKIPPTFPHGILSSSTVFPKLSNTPIFPPKPD